MVGIAADDDGAQDCGAVGGSGGEVAKGGADVSANRNRESRTRVWAL